MKTIGINCHCGNKYAFVLSKKVGECTKCIALHNLDETQSYSTYDVTPLHDIMEQRAKEQAIEDMLDEELESMYRRDRAGQDAAAAGLTLHDYINWSTCFDVQNIEQRVAI
tara:strand:- start:431 stop:763 length:333 start_codon:yes stop_codon:yes gene_type:complete